MLVCNVSMYSQNVYVVSVDSVKRPVNSVRGFHCIFDTNTLENDTPIAILEGTCDNEGKSKLDNLYKKVRQNSRKYNCNAFSVDSTEYYANGSLRVRVSIFRLSQDEIDSSYSQYPHNMIYIFGDIRKSKKKGKKFKLNNKKAKLYPLEYLLIQNKVGEKVAVWEGGIFGNEKWYKGKEGKEPLYISLTGVNVKPFYQNLPRNGGFLYRISSANSIDFNFGAFLSHVMKSRALEEVLEE